MIEWRDIPGYEGTYQVSNTGLVRSLTRTITYCTGKAYTLKGHLMSLAVDRNGYRTLILRVKNNPKRFWVHRLVAMAFLKDYSDSLVVNHLDGNPLNNCIENLEMCTSKQNMEHARRTGLMDDYGEKSVLSKLTNAQAEEIRKRYKNSIVTYKELAEEFGVCAQTICNIINYKGYFNPYESHRC